MIGIDRYPHWRSLSNAVSDARGALALFERLGFTSVTEPLIDGAATQRAIQSLVTDDLATLHPEDSLVLFYAGHGGNRRHVVGDREVATGYLIPVDADERRVSTWVDLEAWLRAAALLPPRHILVILDACHSGIALDPVIKWRDDASAHKESLWTLNARRSRRIITSALEDQRAMDSGPRPGHSLFTGCLIEALTHDLYQGDGAFTTGSELGLHLQRRVAAYPHSQQTPDFGTFAYDARGEMVISLIPDVELERRLEATPTWMKRIDLDDRPVSSENARARPTAADGTGAEGSPAVTAAPAGAAPSASDADVAHNEDLIAMRIDRDAPYAALEIEHPADTTALAPHTEPPQTPAPSPVDATVELAARQESVAAIQTTPAVIPRGQAATVSAAQGGAAADARTKVDAMPDPVEIGSRPVIPWVAPRAGMHPVMLTVLIAAILAVLVTGMIVAWNLLGKSTTSVGSHAAPAPLQPAPTAATAQKTPPPTATIVLETPVPEDVKVLRSGVIESIPASERAVKKAEVIATLKGSQPLEAQVKEMIDDLIRERMLLDAAIKVFDTEHAAGHEDTATAAQAAIIEHRKLIERTQLQLSWPRTMLDSYRVRAPRDGRFVPSARLDDTVAQDAVIGTLVRDAVLVATFKIGHTSAFAANASVEILLLPSKRQFVLKEYLVHLTCTVAEVQPDSVKVVCPPDPELSEGTVVRLAEPR